MDDRVGVLVSSCYTRIVVDARPGEEIGGYRLVRLLGSGSTSSVYLGEHVRIRRRAAVKVLAGDLVDDTTVVRRMLTEAQVVNDIRHPNLIDITDFIEQDEPRRIALLMEYIEGPSLQRFRGAPMEPVTALTLATQLLDGVEAAHERGVIHRDLKPGNLLLTFDPRERPGEVPTLKIVDFGIAKWASAAHQNVSARGSVLGTPAYMAPEQIAGSPAPSPATDVFALGAVIYEMLSGERAYPGDDARDIARRKLRGVRPELHLPPAAAGLLSMLNECLEVRPHERPSISALRLQLMHVLDRLNEEERESFETTVSATSLRDPGVTERFARPLTKRSKSPTLGDAGASPDRDASPTTRWPVLGETQIAMDAQPVSAEDWPRLANEPTIELSAAARGATAIPRTDTIVDDRSSLKFATTKRRLPLLVSSPEPKPPAPTAVTKFSAGDDDTRLLEPPISPPAPGPRAPGLQTVLVRWVRGVDLSNFRRSSWWSSMSTHFQAPGLVGFIGWMLLGLVTVLVLAMVLAR